jgi:hypothetical protein
MTTQWQTWADEVGVQPWKGLPMSKRVFTSVNGNCSAQTLTDWLEVDTAASGT